MDSNIIKEGDTVIFDVNNQKQSFIKVKGKAKLKFGNTYCLANALIGCPYGSLFVLGADGNLERTKHVPSTDWDSPDDVTRGNSKISDINGNQQLTSEDIWEMRNAGKAGEEIINALTANSVTFESKSEYAQEKYRKKKAKKYVLVACARRPTAASIAAAYYAKQPSKIGNLRPDTLALMLNMANVGAHARVLVIESCGGLVSGAVAERLAGFGTVCSSYVGDTPPRMEVCGSFNFDERTRAAMHATPLVRLLEEVQRRRSSDASVAASDAAGAANGPVQAANTTNAGDSGAVGVTEMNEEAAEVAAGQPPVNQGEDVPMAEPAGSAEKRPTEDPVAELPSGALPAAVAYALPFTSCIIACQGVSPTELLTAVLPLLAPSATFALALPLVAPLAECMEALKDGNLAVNMALQETWLREYQVLPMRTHPLNGMSHGGGYILSGTVTVDGAALPLALPQG